jgi:hypothetical protein
VSAAVTPAAAQRTVVHPTPENLSVDGRTIDVSRARTRSGDAALNSFAETLRSMRRVDSIGSLDGDEALSFGTIHDVAVHGSGGLAVLDFANFEVRLFDSAGTPQGRFGRRGSGPMEFRNPVAIWTLDSGRVMVVDAVLGAKRFRENATRPPSLEQTLALMTGATSACGGDAAIALYAPVFSNAIKVGMADRVVHRFTTEGTFARSVGAAYRSTVPLVRADMSEGVVACTRTGATIHALSKLPFVHLVDASGATRWTLRLADFTVPRVTEEIDGSGRRSIGLDPTRLDFSFIRRLTVLDDAFLLVQVTNSNANSLRHRREWATLDTYVVHIASGTAVYVGRGLPMITASRDGDLIGFDNDPYPRVIRLSARR